MAISRLELTDFTVFKRASFDFCPGVNVLIGENGTGKSHVLKSMYAALRAAEKGDINVLPARFRGLFRPDEDNLDRLLRRGAGTDWSVSLLNSVGKQLAFQWPHHHGKAAWKISMDAQRSVFVPPREVLAMYGGFVAAYEGRELDFDETYYDICKALGAAPLKGARAAAVQDLLAPLERILGGRVVLRGNRFFVQQQRHDTEAHLLAEGLRKIACLAYLVANGTLTRDSVLFWDEPEASLNPRLVDQVVGFVHGLARAGIQVFLASHDFLLIHRLSQPAEHGLEHAPLRFFSLYRPEADAPVEVEAAETLADIEHNAILDEFARYHDDERALALRAMAPERPAATTAKKAAKTRAKKSTRKVTKRG